MCRSTTPVAVLSSQTARAASTFAATVAKPTITSGRIEAVAKPAAMAVVESRLLGRLSGVEVVAALVHVAG